MKKMTILVASALFCTLLPMQSAFAAATWPASSSGTNIASGITAYTSGFEASGVTYHDLYGYVIVGDDGDVAIVDSSGVLQDYAMIGGDFEGVTVADQTSDYAYIASENRNSILELDLSTLTLTSKEWELDLLQSGGSGFEAIAYVPAAYAASSWGTPTGAGFFVAGTQADKDVSVYDIDISVTGSSEYSAVAQISTPYTDTAGMHFSTETEILYVLHDSANKMKEYDVYGNQVASYYTPTTAAEEGIYVDPDCASGTGDISITDDGGAVTYTYASYPVSCDQDGDGADATVDCDDTDPTIAWLQEYFEDADSDLLGNPSAAIRECTHTVPAGYAPNSADTNDRIPNWGVEIYGDGIDNDGVDTDGDWAPDGDGVIDEFNTLAENGAHPHYSTITGIGPTMATIRDASISTTDNGHAIVSFWDNAIYDYEVYPTHAIVCTQSLVRRILTPRIDFKRCFQTRTFNAYTGVVL